MKKVNKIAIFPGSFDPFTIGHHDIVMRGLQLFDEIIIGIGHNYTKRDTFPLEERLAAIQRTFNNQSRVHVCAYDGLTIDFAAQHNAHFILRGVRSTLDFEYERNMMQINNMLDSELMTVMLFTRTEYEAVSSSIVRELMAYGKDVAEFLPEGIDINKYRE